MRNTTMVRSRNACAALRKRKAVASTAPSARNVLKPRRRSSKNAFSPPSSEKRNQGRSQHQHQRRHPRQAGHGDGNCWQYQHHAPARWLIANQPGQHRLGLLSDDAGRQPRGRPCTVQRRALRERSRDLRTQRRKLGTRDQKQTPQSPCANCCTAQANSAACGNHSKAPSACMRLPALMPLAGAKAGSGA